MRDALSFSRDVITERLAQRTERKTLAARLNPRRVGFGLSRKHVRPTPSAESEIMTIVWQLAQPKLAKRQPESSRPPARPPRREAALAADLIAASIFT